VIDPKEHFKKAFDDLFRLFQAGRLQKGVPYLFARSSNAMNEERLKNSLHRALTILNQRGGYLYGHWHLSSGVLGLTPELLFSHSEEHPSKVHTMALAGTCPLSEANEAFLKNEKERHEHQLVVHGIYASLKKLGTVKKGEMQLLKLSKLAHLMTPIEIDLFHSFDFDNLVKCLHPTPALGAFPLEEGREWLQGLQREIPRHFYGAPIGIKYSKSGLSKCYVAIRNVQWDERGMRIGAGCGVVQESLFEKEWQEIQLKISSIREQLAL
jgi:menaquinone-specific isochorismate synthase